MLFRSTIVEIAGIMVIVMHVCIMMNVISTLGILCAEMVGEAVNETENKLLPQSGQVQTRR